MTVFQYQGRNAQGKKTQGQIDAANEELAADALINQGIIPTRIDQNKAKPAGGKSIQTSSWFKKSVPLEALVIFCRQLYSLIKAGVPLLRAIKGMAESTTNKELSVALLDIHGDLSNGRPLSDSLKKHPDIFGPLFISMISVGESTGRLDQALLQLSNYFEKEMITRKRIKEAMRYPIVVLSFIAIALTILNIWVIPKFTSMFERLDIELPLPTRILIGTSDFFINYWMYMLLAIVGCIFAFKAWVATPKGRETWDRTRLRIPFIGDIVNRAQLGRFSRTFSLMLNSGVAINTALGLAGEALGNRYLELRLLEMKSDIESGVGIANAGKDTEIFTPLVIQMLTVGEETGQIDELLVEVAEYYEREVEYDLKTLTARIEPILLLFVAGMVLVLALGIFLPTWNMMGAMG